MDRETARGGEEAREARVRTTRDRAATEPRRREEGEERREEAARKLAAAGFERQAAEARRRQSPGRKGCKERAAAELMLKSRQQEVERICKIQEAQRRLRMRGFCVQMWCHV